MEELATDILIIGSGLAGMVSALEAERAGLEVLMVGKFSIGMGTNTSLSNGFLRAANSHFSKAAENIAQLSVPVRLDPGFSLQKTTNFGRMIEKWGVVPLSYLSVLAADEHYSYGYIGAEDFTSAFKFIYMILTTFGATRKSTVVLLPNNNNSAVRSCVGPHRKVIP